MTERNKACFVVPCYNDGSYLKRAIASIEACAPERWELIVVDDGSTDEETKKILSELASGGRRILSSENRGPSAARNLGIAESETDYIIPLDADNTIREPFFEKALVILDTQPDIDVVHSDFRYTGLSDHVCRIEPFDIKKMLYMNYIDTCSVFRRTVWEDCGGYDESKELALHEDWEFWLNAYSKNKKFLHLNMIGFEYTHRADSRLGSPTKGEDWQRAERYLYSKHADLLADCYRDVYRWTYYRRELRSRPIKTLLRLARAFSKKK